MKVNLVPRSGSSVARSEKVRAGPCGMLVRAHGPLGKGKGNTMLPFKRQQLFFLKKVCPAQFDSDQKKLIPFYSNETEPQVSTC